MPGGLLQLVAYGSQDAILTLDPEYTFFKSIYHRYTNFSKSSETILLEDVSNFNEVGKIKIPKKADLLDNISIVLDTPELGVKYSRDIYEEIHFQKNSNSYINTQDYLNINSMLLKTLNSLNERNLFKNVIKDSSNINVLNILDMINRNNSIESKIIYPLFDSALISNFDHNSGIFVNQFLGSTQSKLIKYSASNENSTNYYQDIILNFYYGNNFYQIANYLSTQVADYDINTPNKFLQNLFYIYLNYYSGIKPYSFANLSLSSTEDILGVSPEEYYKSKNIFTYNLIYSKNNISNGESIDFDRTIYGTNYIRFSFSTDRINNIYDVAQFGYVFILNSPIFSLKNILTILKYDDGFSSTNRINEGEQVLFYKILANELNAVSFTTQELGSTFLDNNLYLQNYLYIIPDSNISTQNLWPLDKNIYNIESRQEIRSYRNVYIFKLDNYTNIEIGQLLFAFVDNENNESFFRFTLKVLKINTDSIETELFENRLESNNIQVITGNYSDYNTFPLSYLHLGVTQINPISYRNIDTDIYENFLYVKNSTFNSVKALNNTQYYNNLVTYSGQVLNTQHRLILNFINTLFSGIFHVSTTFTVDQATLQVSDYNETKFFEDTYKIFIKNYLIKNQTENYSSSSNDYNFIKFVRRVVDYLSTPSSVSGVSSFKSNITEKFNLCITKGLLNSNDVINLLDDIRLLEVRKPFLTIKTQNQEGESTGTYTDGQIISINDIVYVYPSDTELSTIGTDTSNTNLIIILQVKEVEYINNIFIRAIVELYDHDISIPNFNLDMLNIDKSFNDAWLAKDNSNLSLVKLKGDLKDESRFDIKLSNFTNTTKELNEIIYNTYHIDFSENPTGITNLDSQIEEGSVYNFYQSTTSNYNENNRELIGKITLSNIVLEEDNTRTFVFFLDSIGDLLNVLFDSNNYYYFAFKVDGAGTDIEAENLSRGLVISSVLTDSRYFTTNILETHQTEATNYKGYKYSNLLSIINCMYLYDQLKNPSKTSFSLIVLKRLFLIASKIYQVTMRNSNYNQQLESSLVLNKRTLKLTYLADTRQIFTSSTIITELLTLNESYTNNNPQILDSDYISTNQIDLMLQDGFRNYLIGKVISLNNPFLVNFSEEEYSSLSIHAGSTKTTQITNELYSQLYGSKFQSGDLTFENDQFDQSLFILTNSSAAYSLTITNNEIFTYSKRYFMFLFDQLPSNLNVTNLSELKNITTRKLYFPAANDIVGHEYTRMLDYYYYDDFLSKESYNIGLYFFKYLGGGPLTTQVIRSQVNKKILEPLSYHGLGATKIQYLQDLQNFYKVNFLDSTFATYLTKASTIDQIKNIDIEDDLNLTSENLKDKIYDELNILPTNDSVADELINLTFSNYETGKSLNSFVNQRISNNEIYNYIKKITYYSSVYQIYSVFTTFINSYLLNNLINFDNITFDDMNNIIINDNFDLSSSLPANNNDSYVKLQISNTDIYIPNSKSQKYKEKLSYISNLSIQNLQNEKELQIEEGKILNKIKNFALISENVYPSIEYLESYLNQNYYYNKNFKIVRGCLVTNLEYTYLNRKPLKLNLNEVKIYGGIKTISVPFSISTILTVNFNVIAFGGKYYINGRERPNLTLKKGHTYRFNVSHNSNSSHKLLFSTQNDGSHTSGAEYLDGVTSSGVSGNNESYIQIVIEENTPTLYYYCQNHSGMGGVIQIVSNGNLGEFSYSNNLLYYQDEAQEINFSKDKSGEYDIGIESIGIAINGVRLRSFISDRIPYDNILNTTYTFSANSLFYFDYQINDLTNKLISVGDVIYFYSKSLISEDWNSDVENSYIEKVTITKVNGNIVTFLSRPSLKFEGSYGYLERFSNTSYQNLPSYNFGLRPINIQIENNSVNLVNNFDKFQVKDVNTHLATNQYNETGYYSGKFINDMSNLDISYIKDSNFNGDNLRHFDGHSKILGFSYDGYPIYGPYGYSNKYYDSNQILVNEATDERKYYDINEEILRIKSSNTFKIFLRTINDGQFIIILNDIIDIDYKLAVNDIIYIHALNDTNSLWNLKYQSYWKIKSINGNILYLQGSTNDILLSQDIIIQSDHEDESSSTLSIEIIKFKSTESNNPVNVTKLIRSSYKFKERFSSNRMSIIEKSQNLITKYNIGSLNEDYEFKERFGDLDQYNGRYCNTPEFPNGTYAYFTTFGENMNPTYPYIIGPKFKNVKSNYLKIKNLTSYYNLSTNVNFISISGTNNPINLSVTTSGQFKINFRTPSNPPPAEDDTDLYKNFYNYLGVNSCIKIICPSKPIYNGYWTVARSDFDYMGNLAVKNVDSSIFTVNDSNNFAYSVANDCIIISYSSYKQINLKNNLPNIEINTGITNSSNLEKYKNRELVRIISENGKFGQCQIIDIGYSVKKLNIKNDGINYNSNLNVYAFIEVQDSLEYVDEHGLLFRRKSKFDEGYFYNYDNNKLEIVDIANSLSSPNFDSSIYKINDIANNFYSLNLNQNIFTKGNLVYTSVNTTQNILLNELSHKITSNDDNINLYNNGTEGEIVIDFDIENDVNINVGDVLYLDFNTVQVSNQQMSRLNHVNNYDDDDGDDLGNWIDTDQDGIPDYIDPNPFVPDTGGADTGGADTGGADTGGADTGGADTGGTDTGGADTGGADTGGADSTNELTQDFYQTNLRNYFKVISRDAFNTYKLNGPSTINMQLPLLTFNTINKLDVYVYKGSEVIFEVNTNINSKKYLTLQNELVITNEEIILSTIDNGKFTLTSNFLLSINQGDIIRIQNSSVSKYNDYFLVHSSLNNVLTLHGSSSLFVLGTNDNLTSTSITASKFDVNNEIGNETVLNILNLDQIISQMGTIDPVYFNDLKNKLFSSFSNDYNTLTLVINDTIKKIVNSSLKDSKIYYNSDIFVNKDYNLENFVNVTNILDQIDNIKSDTINNNFYEVIKLFTSNFRDEFKTYNNLTRAYNQVLNRKTDPEFGWVKQLGTFAFNEIDLYFNDLLIDRQYSSWVNAWNELNVVNNRDLFNKMIGDIDELTEINTKIKKSKKLYIPLRFWFCRYSGINLPLIAMINTDIVLKIKMSNINKLVRKPRSTEPVLYNKPKLKLIANYIYLDDTERKLFAEARHEYIIEQVLNNGSFNIENATKRIDLKFKNCVKDLIWLFDYKKDLSTTDISDFSFNGKNPILKTKIEVNMKKIIDQNDIYFNYVIPYEKYNSSPKEGINVYKFGVDDMSYQPSGTLNFSILDKSEMTVSIDPLSLKLENKHIKVFASSYNILRIMSGHSGIAFIE